MSNTRSARSSTDPVTVVKLGGSLLCLTDLIPRLVRLLQQHAVRRPLVVVGGGAAADLIRRLQPRLQFDDFVAHWSAIAGMTANAHQLARLDRRLRVVADREQAAEVWDDARIPLLNAELFLRREETGLPALPADSGSQLWRYPLRASWDVTSDSIAAWISARWPAREIWLLKSCDSPPDPRTSSAVDAAFAQALPADILLRWINLRIGGMPYIAGQETCPSSQGE